MYNKTLWQIKVYDKLFEHTENSCQNLSVFFASVSKALPPDLSCGSSCHPPFGIPSFSPCCTLDPADHACRHGSDLAVDLFFPFSRDRFLRLAMGAWLWFYSVYPRCQPQSQESVFEMNLTIFPASNTFRRTETCVITVPLHIPVHLEKLTFLPQGHDENSFLQVYRKPCHLTNQLEVHAILPLAFIPSHCAAQ